MGDFSLEWGKDLTKSPSGDFAVATGDVLSRQRVLRVLLTNPRIVLDTGEILPADYIYEPDDGAGLGRVIGSSISPNDVDALSAFVRKALMGEYTVDQSAPVTVSSTIVSGRVRLQITYRVKATGNQISLSLLA